MVHLCHRLLVEHSWDPAPCQVAYVAFVGLASRHPSAVHMHCVVGEGNNCQDQECLRFFYSVLGAAQAWNNEGLLEAAGHSQHQDLAEARMVKASDLFRSPTWALKD